MLKRAGGICGPLMCKVGKGRVLGTGGWGGGVELLDVTLEACGLKGMKKLFIERVRIDECLSPSCLALAGLVQRTKLSTCRPCLSPTCLALAGLVQRTKPSIWGLCDRLCLVLVCRDRYGLGGGSFSSFWDRVFPTWH